MNAEESAHYCKAVKVLAKLPAKLTRNSHHMHFKGSVEFKSTRFWTSNMSGMMIAYIISVRSLWNGNFEVVRQAWQTKISFINDKNGMTSHVSKKFSTTVTQCYASNTNVCTLMDKRLVWTNMLERKRFLWSSNVMKGRKWQRR